MDELTGGFVNYYLAQVASPQRAEQPPYQAECEDIIRALGMNFDEGCEFKAIWRTAAARMGNGKPGQKALYDAEKRVHYAQASLRALQPKQEPVPTTGEQIVIHPYVDDREFGVWYATIGEEFPVGLEPRCVVTVLRESGETIGPVFADMVNWEYNKKSVNPSSMFVAFKIHDVPPVLAGGWYTHIGDAAPDWLHGSIQVEVITADGEVHAKRSLLEWSWRQDGTGSAITLYRLA